MRACEKHEIEGRKCGMRKAGGIEERNLRRLYIKNMKVAGCYLCRDVRYKDLIKKSQCVTFEIVSHAGRERGLLSSSRHPLDEFPQRSRHALHRSFPLRIKLGDKVAVSRWGGKRG